jgi:uncharacterized membrane protein
MHRWLLVLIVLLAYGLRVHQLDSSSFWQDEGLTPLRSGYPIAEILSNNITIQEAVTQDTHPPLYFLIVHFSRQLLGESDFSYRYLSVIAGVLLVPVVYQFGRRLVGRRVGLLAALLTAVNPLYVWYSQEARMYTLLVLLATLASYALWRALSGKHLVRMFILYVTTAGLAFLTHYTAAILIAFQIPFWLWILWRQGQRRLILMGLIAGILLFIPFIPFTVPRLFAGVETNYFYVSPLIMLQDIVHGYGMGPTTRFSQLSIRLLDVGVAIILIAGIIGLQWRRKNVLQQAFLLVLLLAVVIGLALGSLIKPMYQGVRHTIIGSVAFILLLAQGVAVIHQRSRWIGYIGVMVLTLGPLISLNNLFNDPSFVKDDLRSLVRTIESRAGDQDVIIYNNAILLSFHEHYQQRDDLTATALPVYPYTAGGQTEERLARLAEQYERVWFVLDPPADGRDTESVTRRWLDENLTTIEDHTAHSRTMRVGVVAYSTTPWQAESVPADAQNLTVSWDKTPTLRGSLMGFEEPATQPTLWLDLFWQGEQPFVGQQLRFALRGPDGQNWLDYSKPIWSATAEAETDSLLVRASYGLPVPFATPPGEYDLLLLPWNEATGEAIGEWEKLGTIQLGASNSGPPTAITQESDTLFPLRFENELQLLGLRYPADEVRPGHALPLVAYWQAPAIEDSLRYELQVVDSDGQIWISRESKPGPEWLDTSSWPVDVPVSENIGLLIPANAPAGRYRLRWRLLEEGREVSGRPIWRPWSTEWNTYGTISVQPWPLVTELPVVDNIIEAQYGPSIQLHGFDMGATQLSPGGTLDLTLYWRAVSEPDENLHAFVHLISAKDETIISQQDRIPVDWLRPTQGWRENEVIIDTYQLFLPDDLPAGDYHLYAGLYDPETDIRAPVTYQGQSLPDGRLRLVTLAAP